MKCVNCKNCVGFVDMYYLCFIDGEHIEYVEECVANNEDIGCEGFVEDLDDDD